MFPRYSVKVVIGVGTASYVVISPHLVFRTVPLSMRFVKFREVLATPITPHDVFVLGCSNPFHGPP